MRKTEDSRSRKKSDSRRIIQNYLKLASREDVFVINCNKEKTNNYLRLDSHSPGTIAQVTPQCECEPEFSTNKRFTSHDFSRPIISTE